MGQNLARQHGEELLRRFRDLDQLPDTEIMGWPRLPRTRIGPGWARRTPEIEDRFNRLKEIRNARAVALGIDRGVLLSNGLLQAIAEAPPTNLDALRNLAGVRRWQVSVVGEELLKAL
jgi:ribonuclease D